MRIDIPFGTFALVRVDQERKEIVAKAPTLDEVEYAAQKFAGENLQIFRRGPNGVHRIFAKGFTRYGLAELLTRPLVR